jgi:hypothetical protein
MVRAGSRAGNDALRLSERLCYRSLIMAEREPAGPFCFDCVWFPEAPADLEESAPDRAPGRSLTAEFLCPRIRRRVTPTYAAHCPDYQEPSGDR